MLMENMRCGKLAESHMRKFHKFIRRTWPKGGYEVSDNDEMEEVVEKEINLGEVDRAVLEDINFGLSMSDNEEEEAEEWRVPHFFTLSDLDRASNLTCLPHHISSANEITNFVNQVEELLAELSCPIHVTLATSRLDRYLPDSQATRNL